MKSNAGVLIRDFDDLQPGDYVLVRLKPPTSAVWLAVDDDGTQVFADAAGHAIDPAILASMVRDEPIEVQVVDIDDCDRVLRVADDDTALDDALALRPEHILHISLAIAA